MPHDDSDDQDRVVSRRVRNPTSAGADDESVYRAANSPSDDSPTTSGQSDTGGSTSEAAAAEIAEEDESEPRRSE
jgi:hypothetical protein